MNLNEDDDRSDGDEMKSDEEQNVYYFTDKDREEIMEIVWQRINSMIPEYEPLSTPQLLELCEKTAFEYYNLGTDDYDETVLNTVNVILYERGCEKEVHRITEKVKTEGQKLWEDAFAIADQE